MKSESVFQKYAHEYDIMTNAKAREANHSREVQALIDRYHPTTVLDAGCATGLTTMLFGKAGVKAVGLDRSRPMLTVARKKFANTKLPLSFKQGEFEHLPKSMSSSFDLVVCLANSISGVGSITNLKRSLKSFHRVLKPGGSLVLQALNYTSMKAGDIFPIKGSQQGKIGYVRYARRRGRKLEVTAIRLDLSTRPFGYEPFVHEFDNFAPAELARIMREVGFGRPSRYGNLLLSAPFRKSSRDIILLAGKP
jgi:SAM-dependent methyltransferase